MNQVFTLNGSNIVKSEDDLATFETLIVMMFELGKNKEDLKSYYIYLKVGRLSLSAAIRTAIDLCFEKNIFTMEKQKRSFQTWAYIRLFMDDAQWCQTASG